jgi:hypothetical protein
MKQTAVEWLVEKLKENGVDFWQEEIEMIEEAKEMEKEQIMNAHIAGFYSEPFGKSRTGEAKHYYKTTFKSE